MSSQLQPDQTAVGRQPESSGGLGGLKERITGFAQRKPGGFLAAAAAVGFVAGRLLRGSSGDDDNDQREAVTLLIPREEC